MGIVPLFSAISPLFDITSPFLSMTGPTFCLTLLSPLAYEKKYFRLFLHAAIALSSFRFLSFFWESKISLSISILSSFNFSLNGLFKIRLSTLVLLLISILRSGDSSFLSCRFSYFLRNMFICFFDAMVLETLCCFFLCFSHYQFFPVCFI